MPPVGQIAHDDHALVTNYLTNLAREASGASADWVCAAERNLTIYTYGSDPQPGSSRTRITSNQIQDAVNAITDFQTKDPPIRSLDPVERGEPGQVFYYDPMTGQIQGPMTQAQAQQMAQQQVPTGQVDPQSGQPQTQPAFNPANFVTVDDKNTAEYMQKQLDVYWMRGRLDKAVRSAIHYSVVFGYLFPVYEWDFAYHRPRLWNDISLRDTYVDPTRATVEDWAYAGVDWWLDAEQAITMWPHLADIIRERARTGFPERPSSETQLGFNVEQANKAGGLKRNSIIMRVFWLRNQPCPYELDEALAAGLLERQMIPVGDPSAIIEGEDQQFPKGEGDDVQQSGGVPQGQSDAGSGVGTNQPPGDPVAGAPNAQSNGIATPQNPQPQQYRTGLFANGSEVTPPAEGQPLDPNWPMYRCTRQVTAVLGLVVDDRECEYWDMPILQILSTPIPYSPFGQGLPARLAAMQDARNDMLTSIRDHTESQAHPVRVIPKSAWDRLPVSYQQEGASLSGVTVIPDDETYKATNGLKDIFSSPPPMAAALVDGNEIFSKEITERSGNPDILNGRPPAGVTGWQSIQLLSQNASSRFGFSMQWTRDMIARLCRMVLHDISNPKKVTARDLVAIDARYPEPIAAAFQQHSQMMDWNIDVDVQAGVGTARNKKQAEATEAFKIVDPMSGEPVISMETLRDALGYDNEQEERRMDASRQKAQQAAQAQQQPKGPAEAIGYADLPPSGQQQMAAQAGIHLSPQDIAQQQAQDQQQKQDEAAMKAKQNGNGRMSFNGGH